MNDTIIKRHTKFITSQKQIFQLVKDATGFTPVNKEKIAKGYDNEVYQVDTNNNLSFILRIRRYGTLSFSDELWAMIACRAVGVPAAKVIAFGNEIFNGEPHEYMVMEKIKGKSFAEVKDNLSPSEINKVLENAGKVLRLIHTVNAGGFYRKHGENWDFPSWQTYASANVRDREKEKTYSMQTGFNESDFNKIIYYLKYYGDSFSCEQPVLCHGDYLPEHIFIDRNLEITGVLDFGLYEGNHPIHDFGFFTLETTTLPMEPLIKGYGKNEMFQDRFQERLLLHTLGVGMGHLVHAFLEDMSSEVNYLAIRLREILSRLENL